MSNETVTIAGVEFVSPDCCSFGDYGGAGAVGLSNIRTIVEDKRAGEVIEAYMPFPGAYEPEMAEAVRAGATVFHVTGGYSSETVYIRADTELATETLEALADYPSLDDEGVSNIELEWENEAWNSWILHDLERACWPEDQPAGYDAVTAGEKWSAYRFAMELKNEYPEAEYSSVYVNVERIAPTFAAIIGRVLGGEDVDIMARGHDYSKPFEA